LYFEFSSYRDVEMANDDDSAHLVCFPKSQTMPSEIVETIEEIRDAFKQWRHWGKLRKVPWRTTVFWR